MPRLCTLALLLAPLLAAEVVRIQPKFVKGETFSLEIRKARGGNIAGSTTMPVQVTVLDASETGATLDWVPGETRFPATTHPLIAAAAHAIKDLHFEIGLDARGEYAGLGNDRQVIPMLAMVRENVLEQYLPLVPETQRGQLRAYMHQAMSPAALAAGATREAQLLFALNGLEIEPGKPVEKEGETRGPFGAGTIPARTSISVVRLDPGKREAVIAQRQDFDVEALPDVFTGLGAGAGPAGKGYPKLEMFDQTEYVIDTASNSVKSVRHLRTTQAGEGAKRLETTEIVVLR